MIGRTIVMLIVTACVFGIAQYIDANTDVQVNYWSIGTGVAVGILINVIKDEWR